MGKTKICIYCNGQWEGSNYVGGDVFISVIDKTIGFPAFVDMIYAVTGIDRSRFDIVLHTLVQNIDGGSPLKCRVKDEYSVEFLLYDETHLGMVYVDKSLTTVVHAPVSMSPPPPPPNYGTIPLNVPSTSGNNTTPAFEWNGDHGIDDLYNSDTDINVDGIPSGSNIDATIDNTTYPDIIFSGTQFDYDPSQPYWRIPGADLYNIEEISEPIPSFNRSNMYKGAVFMNKGKMTSVVLTYALRNKVDINIRRSNKTRYVAGCRDVKCTFEFRATCRSGCQMWYVYKFVDKHTCGMDTYQSHFRNVKAGTVGQLYSYKLNDRKVRPVDIIGEMQEDYGVQMLYSKAWRALEHATRVAYGKPEESYQQLPSYFHMLKVTNPGTITAIETDDNHRFLYSFMALGASIQGFRHYIRPVVAIDATHLKGDYKGVIFTASAKDGLEKLYPLAFGFGDGELERSWTWFMYKLREVIGMPNDLLIVSDRHQSIANAVATVFPGVTHGICYHHLLQNLKQNCRKKPDVFTNFKNAAYSYLTSECDQYLEQIQKSHTKTYDTLVEIGVERWSRAYCPKKRYRMMSSGIAEALNKCMMKARRLPITSAYELIRSMLQRWFNDRRTLAANSTSVVTTTAQAHIDLVDGLSSHCQTYPIDNLH